MNKELLARFILESREIVLSQPTTGEFPNHDWIEQSLTEFVFEPNTGKLYLYHNVGYEL